MTDQLQVAPRSPQPGAATLVRRAARVGWLVTGTVSRATVTWLATRPRSRRDRFADELAEVVVGRIQNSGPTFVKMAQLLSTRLDVLPPELCARLATLHDSVPAMAPAMARKLAEQTIGAPIDDVFAEFDADAVASGSIACVHRATLLDGTEVAVKLRRAGVAEVLLADLRLMRIIAGLLAKVPAFRSLPVEEMVGQLGDAISAQLDFGREARSLRALAANLRELQGVRVPAVRSDVVDAEQRDGVLVMEYVRDLQRRTLADLPPGSGPKVVNRCLDAVYHMLFNDGLVHADLHPGNLYVMADASIVIVDAGFVSTLSIGAKVSFAEFFLAMAIGDGERCANVLIATGKQPDRFAAHAFRGEIAELVRANSGARSKDFDLLQFSASLFDIQRRYRLYAEPEFLFPILSLLVLEGAIKEFAPDTDFQSKALPYVMNTLADAS